MSKNRERGWRAFIMLLVMGIFVWHSWPIITRDFQDPRPDGALWLVVGLLGLLVSVLLALVVAGILDRDPFDLNRLLRRRRRKRLTRKEILARRDDL